MYELHIANKNYSSWSLRPWILMKALNIPFKEVMHPFGTKDDWKNYKNINPTGLVPCLTHNGLVTWDSLAIIEFLAERHEGIWPTDLEARSWARCVVAEMHAGFPELRHVCSMNCGLRVKLQSITPALAKDIDRVDAIWQEGLQKFGGPFLTGETFSAVDAFYAPVVFRFQTFGINHISTESAAYLKRLLQNSAMLTWYKQALSEPYTHGPHESESQKFGDVIADFRETH